MVQASPRQRVAPQSPMHELIVCELAATGCSVPETMSKLQLSLNTQPWSDHLQLRFLELSPFPWMAAYDKLEAEEATCCVRIAHTVVCFDLPAPCRARTHPLHCCCGNCSVARWHVAWYDDCAHANPALVCLRHQLTGTGTLP